MTIELPILITIIIFVSGFIGGIITVYLNLNLKIQKNELISKENYAEIKILKSQSIDILDKLSRTNTILESLSTSHEMTYNMMQERFSSIENKFNKYDENIESFWKDYNLQKK